uniref:CID domain-containing protein n=1 Tax=Aplanochytrium stocchinoi TaxID=215587 RepID=A0A7S3LJT3_9STRA
MSESEKNLKKFATALKDAIQAPKISASRIGACAEYAYRCNNSKEKAAEVSKRLLKEVGSCGDSKRLCAIYVIDAVLGKCDRKLGKKSVYPRLLKAKLEDSFDLAAYCSADEKKQIVKVLSKWRSLGLFQESLINSWAQKATVVLPTDNDDASKSKDKSTFKEDEKTVLRVDSAISNTSFMSGTYEVEKNDVKIGSDTQIERRSHKRQRKSRWDTDTSTSDAPAITAENMPTGPQPPPYRPAQPRPPAISLDLGIGTSREKEKEVHEDTNTDTDTNAHASDYTLSPNKPTQSHIVNTASSNAIAGGWGAYSGTGNTTNPIHSMATSTAVTGGWYVVLI